jgi:hypothetical protein
MEDAMIPRRILLLVPLLAGPLLAADPPPSSISQEAVRPYLQAPAPAAAAPAPSNAPLTKLPAVRVVADSQHLVRDVEEAERGSNLLAPCVLYTKDLKSGRQFQALGAPVKPMAEDPPSTVRQPHFPLVSLAW